MLTELLRTLHEGTDIAENGLTTKNRPTLHLVAQED